MNIVRFVWALAKGACHWVCPIEVATSLATTNRKCTSESKLAVQLFQSFLALLVLYSAIWWENHTCLWVLLKLTIQQLGTNQQCCLQLAHCSSLVLEIETIYHSSRIRHSCLMPFSYSRLDRAANLIWLLKNSYSCQSCFRACLALSRICWTVSAIVISLSSCIALSWCPANRLLSAHS